MEIPDPHICVYVVNGGYLALHVTRDTEEDYGEFQMSTFHSKEAIMALVQRVLTEWEGPAFDDRVPDSLKEFTDKKKSRKAHDE